MLLVELSSSPDGSISDLYTHSSVSNKICINNPIKHVPKQLTSLVKIANLQLVTLSSNLQHLTHCVKYLDDTRTLFLSKTLHFHEANYVLPFFRILRSFI